MAAKIYELRGQGIAGSPVMAHLVAIGAHDGLNGSAAQVVKVPPSAQFRSWFAPEGGYFGERRAVHEGHPIVAQIFFPFGDATIDTMTDRVALDALIAHVRFELAQGYRQELEFIGSADPRGAAAFNRILARKRAEQVRDYVDRRVSRNVVEKLQHARFKSMVTSRGEDQPTGDYRADRRVDVVLRSRIVRDYIDFGDKPLVIPGDYKGPLTRKLQFRGYGGIALSEGVGIETMEVEIRNPRTGKSAFYRYYGANISTPSPIPIGVGLPDSGYTDKEIPLGFGWVDVDDFSGIGSVSSASVLKSGSVLMFSGPKLHHSKHVVRKKGMEVFLQGINIQVPGGSIGGGYWRKQRYRTAEERQEFQERLQRERRSIRERLGPRP